MSSASRKTALVLAFIALSLASAWYVYSRPMDFRVYYFGSEGFFHDKRPVYGNYSGMGWPMHYRYPPLFLFMAVPFTWLPLPWAASLWVVLKCAALFLLVGALWKRHGPATSKAAWLIPLLLAGPYVIEEFRYGNAQFFIFALTGAALLALSAAPLLASLALALAISIKVWPLFFIPYLAVRREWKVVGATLAITVVLLLLPSLYFGVGGNAYLMREWARQEFFTQTGESELSFPSQSLRGVLMRYLTFLDYSTMADTRYVTVHLATISPATVRMLWLALAGLCYVGFLILSAKRRRGGVFGLTEALAFTGIILLEPFSQKYTLVILLWPAMVAGRLAGGRARGLLYAAAGISIVQPLISGSAAQRLLQVLGFDFLITALLAAFLVLSILALPTERSSSG